MKSILLNINKQDISEEFFPEEISARVAPRITSKTGPVRVFLYHKGMVVGDFVCNRNKEVFSNGGYEGRSLRVSHLDRYSEPISFQEFCELFTNKGREITVPPISFYYVEEKLDAE